MSKTKILCRVCKKPFEPCSYCQSHSEVFRWRNFACSIECAKKYIDDTVKYRESLNKKNGEKQVKDKQIESKQVETKQKDSKQEDNKSLDIDTTAYSKTKSQEKSEKKVTE